MSISDATVFWIETGAMQGEKRYILEMGENLAEYFDEKAGRNTTVDIHHQGTLWTDQPLKHHDAEHYSPQWRIFLPREFSRFSPTYYPDKVAKFKKQTKSGSRYYDLILRSPSHQDVDEWRREADTRGVRESTAPGDRGREYGYY